MTHEINNVPGEKAALQRELEDAEAQLDRAKTRAKEIEVERARLEVEAGTKRAQADKYRTQQLETRKNEEYAALKHEIDRVEADITAIEDRELELMQADKPRWVLFSAWLHRGSNYIEGRLPTLRPSNEPKPRSR